MDAVAPLSAAERFRHMLAGPELLTCSAIDGPLSARIAQQAGIDLALLGGFPVAAVRFGLPDTGLIAFAEMVEQTRATCAAVPGYPVIADADNGYGNAMNVRRTVLEYARAGAACLHIEDQLWPKKCGHYPGGRRVCPRDEARIKIRAAVDARRETGADILILARTDARSGVGFDEAMARCHDFEEEGADLLFIEAMESEDEMRRFADAFPDTPVCASLLPKSPQLSRAIIHEMGFKMVSYLLQLPAMIRAMQQMAAAIVADDMSLAPPAVSFPDMLRLVGLDEYEAASERYRLPE